MKFIILQAATNITSNFNTNFTIFVPFILIGIALAVISMMLYASSDLAKYHRFKDVLKKIARSFQYTAYGILTFVVVAVPVYLGYILFTAAAENPSDSLEVLKWISIIVGAYIGFTILGWVTKNRIWIRLKNFKEADQHKKIMKF